MRAFEQLQSARRTRTPGKHTQNGTPRKGCQSEDVDVSAGNPIVMTPVRKPSRLHQSEASSCHPFRVTLLGTTFPGVRGSASTLDLVRRPAPPAYSYPRRSPVPPHDVKSSHRACRDDWDSRRRENQMKTIRPATNYPGIRSKNQGRRSSGTNVLRQDAFSDVVMHDSTISLAQAEAIVRSGNGRGI